MQQTHLWHVQLSDVSIRAPGHNALHLAVHTEHEPIQDAHHEHGRGDALVQPAHALREGWEKESEIWR